MSDLVATLSEIVRSHESIKSEFEAARKAIRARVQRVVDTAIPLRKLCDPTNEHRPSFSRHLASAAMKLGEAIGKHEWNREIEYDVPLPIRLGVDVTYFTEDGKFLARLVIDGKTKVFRADEVSKGIYLRKCAIQWMQRRDLNNPKAVAAEIARAILESAIAGKADDVATLVKLGLGYSAAAHFLDCLGFHLIQELLVNQNRVSPSILAECGWPSGCSPESLPSEKQIEVSGDKAPAESRPAKLFDELPTDLVAGIKDAIRSAFREGKQSAKAEDEQSKGLTPSAIVAPGRDRDIEEMESQKNIDGVESTIGANLVKASVNARMIDVLTKRPESQSWSITSWVKHLKCARATVHATKAWKQIQKMREDAGVERIERGTFRDQSGNRRNRTD